MFIHSVKVHRLYKTAAKIIKQVCEEGKGVKHLLFEQTRINIKTLNALVFETLRHAEQIDLLLRKSNLLIDEPRFDPWLARVLMTELLWGQKEKLKSEAKPVKTILTYEKKFRAILRDSDVEIPEPTKQVYHPRYVRVNTLTMSVQEAINGFRDQGWTLIRPEFETNNGADWSYRDFLKSVRDLKPDTFMIDYHIPELLVFPPGTHFHDYQCYLDGHIVLQDKASCMAAHLLNPPPNSKVLDMCAAPGMKATHLAALVGSGGGRNGGDENGYGEEGGEISGGGGGKVYAVEKDARRHGVLAEIVAGTRASPLVETIHDDVLRVGDERCPGVEYVLVDPSCSGTGMLDRIESSASTLKYVDEKRLKSLSGFQILILRRALTAYRKAKRVVYSTCSVMPQENEQVVKEVLETTKQFRLVPVREILQKDWLSFGSDEYKDIGENCLYARPEVDYTNGFFMAVFERISPYDERDLYVRGRKWKRDIGGGTKKSMEIVGDTEMEGFNGKSGEKSKKSRKRDTRELSQNLETAENLRKDTDVVNSELADDNIVKKSKKSKKHDKELIENLEMTENLINESVNSGLVDENKVKKCKKSKKRVRELSENFDLVDTVISIDENKAKKCKKSKKRDRELIENLEMTENLINESVNSGLADENKVKKSKKSKKRDRGLGENLDLVDTVLITENKVKKSKKSKKHNTELIENLETTENLINESVNLEESNAKKCKKSKKSKSKDMYITDDNFDQGLLTKKNKKSKTEIDEVVYQKKHKKTDKY